MADYETLYHKLYNRITDVIDDLQKVQQETEELYIKGKDGLAIPFLKSETTAPDDKTPECPNCEVPEKKETC